MKDKVLIDRAVVEQPKPSAKYSDVVSDGGMDPRNIALEHPQVEQEPVAVIGDVWTLNWVGSDPIAAVVKKHGLKIGDKLYAHQQPPRQPLTDEQIDGLLENVIGSLPVARKLIRAIEAAHGIKEQK